MQNGCTTNLAVLNVQHAIGVALQVRVVGHHDARGPGLAVDGEQQVHDLNRVLGVQVACRHSQRDRGELYS
jgi:hypothetical protein